VVLSGNQALDPAGLAPALVTSNRRKVTFQSVKKLTRPTNTWPNINPARAASTYSFWFLPGQIDQIPLISQGLGCIEVPNG
jgi:hypothetical protein